MIIDKGDVYNFIMVDIHIIKGCKNYIKRVESDNCYLHAWMLSMVETDQNIEQWFFGLNLITITCMHGCFQWLKPIKILKNIFWAYKRS
jgi:hypothetical protein